jgi:hypothetical protein
LQKAQAIMQEEKDCIMACELAEEEKKEFEELARRKAERDYQSASYALMMQQTVCVFENKSY